MPPNRNEASDSDTDSDTDNEVTYDPTIQVPMFVVVGNGGRTMVSCDDGVSWIADRSIDNNNENHSQTTDKGFTYGNGVFIQAMGWGYNTIIQRSENGIDWETQSFTDRSTAISFSGDNFLRYGNGAFLSRDLGLTWEPVTPPNHGDHAREGGGGGEPNGPSIMAIGNGHSPTYSTDEGLTWKRAPEFCDSVANFGGVGNVGGLAYGENVFVAVDYEGDFCSTSDFGSNWHHGSIDNYSLGPSNYVGKLSYAYPHFWATTGDRAHRSENGKDWETVYFEPEGTMIHFISRSDAGTYVGLDRNTSTFYRSFDGVTWIKISTYDNSLKLQRMEFGYASASKECPN